MGENSSRFGVEIKTDFNDFFDPFEDFDNQGTAAISVPRADNSDFLLNDLDFGSDVPADVQGVKQTKDQIIDDRPAEERLAELIKSMDSQRHTILGVLRMCKTPQHVASVNQYVSEAQQYNVSVFSAANICSLLEKEGGLERVTEEGLRFDEFEVEPVTVVDEDGVECLQPGEPPEVFWVSTPEGLAIADAGDPAADLRAVLEKESAYLHVYKRVLEMASSPEGASRDAIFNAVDPALAKIKPRMYSPHFVDKLFKCDALVWRNAWFITDLGSRCLESMADVADVEETPGDGSADESAVAQAVAQTSAAETKNA